MLAFAWRRKWLVGGLGLVTLLGAGLAWSGREQLKTWYALQRLLRADPEECGYWVQRLTAADSAAVPGLLNCFARAEPQVCDNAAAALASIVASWPASDGRRGDLVRQLAARFAQLSRPGQCRILQLQAAWIEAGNRDNTAYLLRNSYRCLQLSGRSPDAEIRLRALQLAGVLVAQPVPAEARASCREYLRLGLQDPEPANRAEAARLAADGQLSLLPQVAPLLDDPAAVVRRAAMLAVGPAAEAITTDDLLRSLHDSDADVRILCEKALKSRGLSGGDVLLGRLVSDARPAVRLEVFAKLQRIDREPGVWLRRLSHDPAPAVRAAAVRAAGEQHQVDLSERLRQMAENDPSPTVRQLAQHSFERQRMRQLQTPAR